MKDRDVVGARRASLQGTPAVTLGDLFVACVVEAIELGYVDLGGEG